MTKTYKITLKLVRSFSIGFVIYSPTLNGLCIELHFACFHLMLRSRGQEMFGVENYWRHYL